MTGKTLRFVNFLLDSCIYGCILTICMQALKNVIGVENIKWLLGISYFLYYFLFEYFGGQTPGKMITKSRVIFSEGHDYYFIRLFLRTLMRFIPLDILSYLFTARGFHDMVSMTYVIKLNKRQLNQAPGGAFREEPAIGRT